MAILLMSVAGMAQVQTYEFAPLGAEWHYEYQEMFAKGYIKMSIKSDA